MMHVVNNRLPARYAFAGTLPLVAGDILQLARLSIARPRLHSAVSALWAAGEVLKGELERNHLRIRAM
jgi:hypothetical protein